MNEIKFENVLNYLQNVMPKKWNKVIFYAEYTQGSYSMKYFVDLGDGKFTDCYALNGITKMEIVDAFMKIDKEISNVRSTLNDNEKWTVMTLQVGEEGRFKVEYDYGDTDGNTIQYHENWKKKYLQ